jgi:hypothetical protein
LIPFTEGLQGGCRPMDRGCGALVLISALALGACRSLWFSEQLQPARPLCARQSLRA